MRITTATGMRKGAWTKEEDFLLKKFIEKYGEGKWHQIPVKTGLKRCRKSCRLRWLNYLRPSIKRGQFSEDEIDLILRLHKLIGNRWSLIAGRLPGRTANDVKNYWNTHLHKKLLASQLESEQEEDEGDKTQKKPESSIVKPYPWTFSKTAIYNWTRENENCEANIFSNENVIPYQPSSLASLESNHKESEGDKSQKNPEGSIVKPVPWNLSKMAIYSWTKGNETCKENIFSNETNIPYKPSSMASIESSNDAFQWWNNMLLHGKEIGEGTSFSSSNYLPDGNMPLPEELSVGLQREHDNDNSVPAAQDEWSNLSDLYMGIWDFGLQGWKSF